MTDGSGADEEAAYNEVEGGTFVDASDERAPLMDEDGNWDEDEDEDNEEEHWGYTAGETAAFEGSGDGVLLFGEEKEDTEDGHTRVRISGMKIDVAGGGGETRFEDRHPYQEPEERQTQYFVLDTQSLPTDNVYM